MKNKNKLGEVIHNLRKKKNLTQEELAALLGVSNKAVSKWETGVAYPSIQLLPQLTKILDVTLEEFMSNISK